MDVTATYGDDGRHSFHADMVLEEAIRRAIDECIAEDILAEFLRAHRNEVEKIIRARAETHR